MVTCLIIHFSFLFIYTHPFNWQKTKIHFLAQNYTYPYFHQNWNLFIPIPDTNYKLYCYYQQNGKQVIDIFSEVLIKHQTNRFSGYEPLLLSLINSIHYFEKNTAQQNVLNGPIVGDLNFKIVEHIVKNYIVYSKKIKLEDLKIILVTTKIGSLKQKVYFN